MGFLLDLQLLEKSGDLGLSAFYILFIINIFSAVYLFLSTQNSFSSLCPLFSIPCSMFVILVMTVPFYGVKENISTGTGRWQTVKDCGYSRPMQDQNARYEARVNAPWASSYSVFYRFSCKPHNVITFLICIIKNVFMSKRKKEIPKKKHAILQKFKRPVKYWAIIFHVICTVHVFDVFIESECGNCRFV